MKKKVLIKVQIVGEGLKILRNVHLDLSYVVKVKSTVEISQNFVAFSEYVNFKNGKIRYLRKIHNKTLQKKVTLSSQTKFVSL